MKKKYTTILITASLLLAGCGKGKDNTPVHSVLTTTPELASGASVRNFSGTVEAGKEVNAGFKTSGHLKRIMVKEGDYVRQGQVLATLDDQDIRLQVQTMQVQYDQTARQTERIRKLYEGKSVSGNDYDKAKSGLEETALTLQSMKNRLAYCTLYAPVSGYIKKVNYEESEMVMEGQALCVIMAQAVKEVLVSIPADLYERRADFADISCASTLHPDQRCAAKLTNIVPKADGNQLYEARFTLTGENSLQVGENVSVVICLRQNDTAEAQSLKIPAKAVFESDGGSAVWVIAKDSTVNRHPVTVLGYDDKGFAIVSGDMNPTDIIVRAGVRVLQEGEKVTIIDEKHV